MKRPRLYRSPFSLLLLAILAVQGCKTKDTPHPAASGHYSHGVWIVNEGGFTYGNASIDFLHTDKDSLERDVFYNANNHYLGDVLQCMVPYNSQYYMVLNNSSEIVVAGQTDMKKTAVIDGFSLPRYFMPINESKAYVSSITGDGIDVLNLKTNSIASHIAYKPTKDSLWRGWTEQMALLNNEAWVCAVKRGKILIINTETDAIKDSVSLSIGSKNILSDKENHLWILCDGTLSLPFIASKLYCIEPGTRKVLQEYALPNINSGAGNLQKNAAGDSIYYVSGGVYKMGIHQGSLSAKPVVDGSGRNFYGLGISPIDNSIYVGDAHKFTQNGEVRHYTPGGRLIKSYTVGVGPNGFVFAP